jgi:hypothetical protein
MMLRPGPDRGSRGSATAEFLLIAIVVLLPLVFGTLELALLAVTRHTLGVASLMAARAGAVEHGDRGVMQRTLARGLSPLYAVHGDSEALARSYADVLRPDRTRIEIWSPVAASFADFGEMVDGRIEIPNVWPQGRVRVGAASRQTIFEANQLGMRVSICRTLLFPLTASMINPVLGDRDPDTFGQGCRAQRGVPLHARVLVHMHSPARRDAMGI